MNLSKGGADLPDTDVVVGVTGEEGLTVSGPGKGDTLGSLRLLSNVVELGNELNNNGLALEIPDLDLGSSGSTEPVSVGGEDKGVNHVTGGEGVKVLTLVEVPEHGDTVLTARGAEGSIGGDGDSVDVTGVVNVAGLELELSNVPDLYISCD